MSNLTYIVAVSGGVDSVVLLHKLITAASNVSYVVAHFDHGIRSDSAADAEFVGGLARHYGLRFESKRIELEAGASEDVARTYRYRFLRSIKSKYKAQAIVTAHHQDDVLETMVICLLRKSGVRSFVGYTAQDVLRPLLSMPKAEIVAYAKENGLDWREDSTNEDETYLRNYVRKRILPKLELVRPESLSIRAQIQQSISERDVLAKHLLVSMMRSGQLNRRLFLPLPYVVQREVVFQWLKLNGVHVSPHMVERVTIAIKVMQPGKHLELAINAKLYSHKNSVLLKVDGNSV